MTLAAFILSGIAAVLTGVGLTRPEPQSPRWYGVSLLLVSIAVCLVTWSPLLFKGGK